MGSGTSIVGITIGTSSAGAFSFSVAGDISIVGRTIGSGSTGGFGFSIIRTSSSAVVTGESDFSAGSDTSIVDITRGT